jgi:hypothetical protein
MQHRHLTQSAVSPTTLTLAAIDDIIQRGKMDDWKALRAAVLGDVSVMDKVERIAQQYIADPYRQRHHFWNNYVKSHRGIAA